jgi:hypothetical protein
VTIERHLFADARHRLAALLLFAATGCGSQASKEQSVAPTHSQLRTLALVYTQASFGLNRPPTNAEDLKPYLAKLGGNDNESPPPEIDWANWVVHWGVDPKNLTIGADGAYPIWVYEKSPQSGKRWVVQGRHPAELTEEQFRSATFAPGLKKPF